MSRKNKPSEVEAKKSIMRVHLEPESGEMLGDAADGHSVQPIGTQLAVAALCKLGVDDCGLDWLDRAYLAVVSKGPVGIAAIANTLSEQQTTIEDVVEPFLFQLGRTVRGRLLTAAGHTHLRSHDERPAGR